MLREELGDTAAGWCHLENHITAQFMPHGASQAQAEWDIAAGPRTRDTSGYVTIVPQRLAGGTVRLLGSDGETREDIPCNIPSPSL